MLCLAVAGLAGGQEKKGVTDPQSPDFELRSAGQCDEEAFRAIWARITGTKEGVPEILCGPFTHSKRGETWWRAWTERKYVKLTCGPGAIQFSFTLGGGGPSDCRLADIRKKGSIKKIRWPTDEALNYIELSKEQLEGIANDKFTAIFGWFPTDAYLYNVDSYEHSFTATWRKRQGDRFHEDSKLRIDIERGLLIRTTLQWPEDEPWVEPVINRQTAKKIAHECVPGFKFHKYQRPGGSYRYEIAGAALRYVSIKNLETDKWRKILAWVVPFDMLSTHWGAMQSWRGIKVERCGKTYGGLQRYVRVDIDAVSGDVLRTQQTSKPWFPELSNEEDLSDSTNCDMEVMPHELPGCCGCF